MNAVVMGDCHTCFARAVRDDACGECGARQEERRNVRALRLWSEIAARYRLGKVLGAGGFGITYLARDTQLGRLVAVKEYFPGSLASRPNGNFEVMVNSSDDEAPFLRGLKRFFSEGKHLARFTHPNIVCVHDVIEANGTAYLVMQYHDGMTLKAHLANVGRLPCADALHFIQFVLDALKAVHRENLVHRDVKPDNIYITAAGRVMLLDFGGAKQLVTEGDQTTGDAMFAHGYAAPEQYFADRDQIKASTDVYGTAATLYHMLTGERMPGALERDRETRLDWHGIDLPVTVREILERALQIEQKDRPQSIEELSNQLAEAMPSSRPATIPDVRPQRRGLLVAIAAGGAAIGAGALWIFGPRPAGIPAGGAITPIADAGSPPVAPRNVRDRLSDMRALAAGNDWPMVEKEAQFLRQCCSAKDAQPDKKLLAQADAETARGNFAQAQKLLEQAVLKSPAAAEPWAALGFALMRLRKASAAKEAALQALGLEASNSSAWSVLAEALGDDSPGAGAGEAAQLAVYFSIDRAYMTSYLRESAFRGEAFRSIISGMGNRLDQVPVRVASTP